MLKALQEFMESEGGERTIIIGLLLWLGSIAAYMHVTGHDPAEVGRTLLSNTFTALFTALMIKIGGKKQP